MSDERDKLKQEVEALKAARLAKEAEAKAAVVRREAESRADATRSDVGRLRSSLSRWTAGTVVALTMFGGVALAIAYDEDAQAVDQRAKWLGIAFLVSAVLRILWRQTSPARFHAWLAALPWPVEGLTALLAGGKAVSVVEVGLRFRDTVPAEDVVRELVLAHVPRRDEDSDPPKVVRGNGGIVITVELSTEDANYPLRDLFHRLERKVLRPVHAAFPLRAVEVSAARLTDFYVGGGD